MSLRSLFSRLRGEPAAAPALPESDWLRLTARVPWLARLDAARTPRLRALIERFLADKTITPVGDLTLDDGQRQILAALCCLPVLEFGYGGLHGWSQLLVYPEAFRVQRSHLDADGVLHEWQDELIGEAWQAGPLILSWADIESDLAEPDAGFCVAAHEVAHKLDALDGALDGTPPLPRAWQREWARDFQSAFEAFCAEVDAGRETAIDPYAAEGEDEFFAVLTEYHFSAPALLAQEMPAVAAHLARFYGPSPMK